MYAVLILLIVIIVLALTLVATVKTVVFPQTNLFKLCSKSGAVDACHTTGNVPHFGGIHRLSPNASIIFNVPDLNPDVYKWHDDDGEHKFCVEQSVNPSSNHECRIPADPSLFDEKASINFGLNSVDSGRKLVIAASSESTGTLVSDTVTRNELPTMSMRVDASDSHWHEINLNEK